jgi:hypothetical protein
VGVCNLPIPTNARPELCTALIDVELATLLDLIILINAPGQANLFIETG